MGQTQCSYVYPDRYFSSSGNKSTTQPQYKCEFKQFGWLKEASREDKYTVFYGVASLLFILSLWFLVFKIRHKDFSRTYVISTLAPMTLLAIYKTIEKVPEIRKPFEYYIVSTLLNMAWLTVDTNFNLSTITFLIMNFYAARKRVALRRDCLVFGLILIFSIVYGILSSLTDLAYTSSKGFSGLCRLVMGCVWLVLLFSLCCCTNPHFDQSVPPTITNARSRLGWSLLFVVVFSIPLSLIWGGFGDLFYILDGVVVSILIIVINMIPILYCICVVLFLPAFRSALFCSQGSGRETDIEAVKPSKAEIAASRSQFIPPARVAPNLQDFGVRDGVYGQAETVPKTLLPGQPVTPQPPMGWQNYGYQQHQTGFQHGQPLPVPFPMTPNLAAQPTYLFPSNALTVEQYQVHPSPVMAQQHTVASPPLILGQQQMMPVSHQIVSAPMVQSNLVRIASQPNLAQMTTLQPAANTSHLVVQSPFYVHS